MTATRYQCPACQRSIAAYAGVYANNDGRRSVTLHEHQEVKGGRWCPNRTVVVAAAHQEASRA